MNVNFSQIACFLILGIILIAVGLNHYFGAAEIIVGAVIVSFAAGLRVKIWKINEESTVILYHACEAEIAKCPLEYSLKEAEENLTEAAEDLAEANEEYVEALKRVHEARERLTTETGPGDGRRNLQS